MINKIRIGNQFTFDVKIYKVEEGANIMLDLNLYNNLSVSVINTQKRTVIQVSQLVLSDGTVQVTIPNTVKELGSYSVVVKFDVYTFDALAFELVSSSALADQNHVGHEDDGITIEFRENICGLLTLQTATIVDLTNPYTGIDLENMMCIAYHRGLAKWVAIPASLLEAQKSTEFDYKFPFTFKN